MRSFVKGFVLLSEPLEDRRLVKRRVTSSRFQLPKQHFNGCDGKRMYEAKNHKRMVVQEATAIIPARHDRGLDWGRRYWK